MDGVRDYGLGMTRAEAIAAFEALGYAFQVPAESPGRHRRPRAIGEMLDGGRRIELIGPEEHVFKAVLVANLDGEEQAAATPFLRLIAPDWVEGSEWFAHQIAQGAQLDGAGMKLPGLEVWLRTMADRAQLVLTLSWVAR